MNRVCYRLHDAMVRAGMRQVDLEKKTGISRSSLSRYLSGAYEPNADKLHRLAVALDVSEAWLLGYDVAPERLPAEDAAAISETLEEEMSRRMLDEIIAVYDRMSFAGRVALFEYVKKEASRVDPQA